MNTTIRRPHPAKPVHLAEHTKQTTSDEALKFLNQFMMEARKEIRKRETLTIKGKLSKTDCDVVTFLSETFSLTINFKEGMTHD